MNENEAMKQMLAQILMGITNANPPKIESVEEIPKKDSITPLAQTVRNTYDAFVGVGFDDQQAYEMTYCILEVMLNAATRGNS